MKKSNLIVITLLLTNLMHHLSDACGPNIRVRGLTGGITAGIRGVAVAFYQYFSDEIKGKLWEVLEWSGTRSFQHVAGWKERVLPMKSFPETPQHSLVIRSNELQDITKMFKERSSKCRVTFLYLLDLPGSGKSELARQYGERGFDRGEYATVIALNAETEEQFRRDMVNAVLEIQSSTNIKAEVKSNIFRETLPYLSNELRQLLKERPDWLLVVDNIRELELSLELLKYVPKAGSERWGKGHVLLTTQIEDIVSPQPGQCVTLKKINEGMVSMDARRLLCSLVNVSHSDNQCLADAESVVEQLEYLPLAILAAGVFINEEMVTNESYSLAAYIQDFELNMKSSATYYEHFGASGAFPYKYSMQTALRMAVNQSIHIGTDDYQRMIRDVYFFIGFIDQQEVSYYFLNRFLENKGHDKGHIHLLTHSSFMDFIKSKNMFKVHQVTRDSFRFIVKKQFKLNGIEPGISSAETFQYESVLIAKFEHVSEFLFNEYETTDDTTLYFFAKSFFARVYSDCGYVLPDITRSKSLETSGSLFTILILVEGFTPDRNQNCTSPFYCKFTQTFLHKLYDAQVKSSKPIPSVSFQAGMLLIQVYRHVVRDEEQARQFEEHCIKLIKQTIPEYTIAEATTFFRVCCVSMSTQESDEYQSRIVDKNDRRKYHAQVIRFATNLLRRTYLDLAYFLVVGKWCVEGEMLEDAKEHFENFLKKFRSSSLTKIFPYYPLAGLFELGHVNKLLQDYASAEAAFTEGFSMPLDLDDPAHSLLSVSNTAHSYRLELGEVKIHLNKFDDALEDLQLAMSMYGNKKMQDDFVFALFPLKIIVQLLRMIQRHKSNSSVTFSISSGTKDLLSKCLSAVQEEVQSGQIGYYQETLEHKKQMEQFIEAVNLSNGICDKKTAQTLLQIATKLEEAIHDYGAVSEHSVQTELKLLSEKTNSLRCSTFDEMMHSISGLLVKVRSYIL